MIFLGIKLGMSTFFDKTGIAIPITLIKSGPCIIIDIKKISKHGYNAITIGYKQLLGNSKQITKALLGQFNKHNLPIFQYVKEFRMLSINNYYIGQILTIDKLNLNTTVNIRGLTVGKGTSGNIKHHNFNSGPTSHGSKHKRLQGSLGAGTSPGRVFPGKKMPKRVGHEQCVIKNLKLINLNLNENLIMLKGSIPGKKGNLISIF